MECGSGRTCGNCGNLCGGQFSLFGTSINLCEISGNAVSKDEAACEFWIEQSFEELRNMQNKRNLNCIGQEAVRENLLS